MGERTFLSERVGDVHIMHVVGTVDRLDVEDFGVALDRAIAGARGPLFVSFVECVSLHPAALNGVESAHGALGERLHLVARPQSQPRRTLESSAFALPIKDEFAHAVAATASSTAS